MARSAPSRRAGQVLYWSGIALLVFVMVLPFLWMVATSLMDELAVFAYPPPLVPRTARFSNTSTPGARCPSDGST